jgi:hypothetical protein
MTALLFKRAPNRRIDIVGEWKSAPSDPPRTVDFMPDQTVLVKQQPDGHNVVLSGTYVTNGETTKVDITRETIDGTDSQRVSTSTPIDYTCRMDSEGRTLRVVHGNGFLTFTRSAAGT